MSFWNTFDLGILGLLVAFYVLRLYGQVVNGHSVFDCQCLFPRCV